ncbi:MAG TPA: MBL fold metallo-hydrolase [Longilinea sp.]|nr:MBL fold metallo-hydrolase [Longilinea sp.]
MSQLTILGSAFAVAQPSTENTHLILQHGQHTILVDCASNPIVRMQMAGIEWQSLTEVIVTHFHPDHVSGIALMFMDMWLLGRKQELHVYGLEDVIRRIEAMMELYRWKTWPGFYPVVFHSFPEQENNILIDDDQIKVTGSLVQHVIPTMGLRFELRPQGKSLAYTCDSEPCPAIIRLAHGVDVLLHEAAGAGKWHSSPAQAAQSAVEAGAKALYLIHYDPKGDHESMLREARQGFLGRVDLAKDFMRIDLS